MSNTSTHRFVSTVPDLGVSTEVSPNKWNDEHVFGGGANGALLVRDSTQTDGATWSNTYAGPYSLGTGTSTLNHLTQGGSFTPSGSGGSAHALTTTITAGAGFSASLLSIAGTIVEAASGTHAELAGLLVAPSFTDNAGATATRVLGARFSSFTAPAGTSTAATVYVAGAPIGGATNLALWVDLNDTRLDGNLQVQGTGPHHFGEAAGASLMSQVRFAGSYTSTSATTGGKVHIAGTFTAEAAQSAALAMVNGILAEAGSGIHADLSGLALQGTFANGAATATRVSQLRLSGFAAPAGTDRAQLVYLAALPTGATANYGVYSRAPLYFQASGTDTDPHAAIATANGSAAIHLSKNNVTGVDATLTLVQTGTANEHGPQVAFFKTRHSGDAGQPSALAAGGGDVLGDFRFWGAVSGTAYAEFVRIQAVSDGSVGAGDAPGRLDILTTPDGSATPVLRQRITNAGAVLFGAATNTNMTQGVTVDQNASDNQAVSIQSTGDVAHGLTIGGLAAMDTASYLNIQKLSATLGGALVQSVAENPGAAAAALLLAALGGEASTSPGTSGVPLMHLRAAEHDGANALINAPAGQLLLGLDARVGGAWSQVFSVSAAGNVWAGGHTVTSLANTTELVLAHTGTPLRLRTSGATPGTLADGDWWVEAVGTSPTRVVAIKMRDGGATRTIASVTY